VHGLVDLVPFLNFPPTQASHIVDRPSDTLYRPLSHSRHKLRWPAPASKGVKEKSVIFKHALRNGLLPVITVAGDQAAAIANGAVIVETIFGWPGIGKLMIDSILQRDFAVVQASILITAIVILSINIIIDIAYATLDPRIRHK